jgi:hypothetical protein
VTAQLRIDVCVCGCGQRGGIAGRGLIQTCYWREQYRGTLTDWPRQTWAAADFIDDYRLLKGQGYTHPQIAERLGYPLLSMQRQICRLRSRGLLERPAGVR